MSSERKIRDYTCSKNVYEGIDRRIIDKYSLEFPKSYRESRFISLISSSMRRLNDDIYCMLPFFHTVEAESMGADIIFGDEKTGSRAGKYCCDTMKDVLELKDINFNEGIIKEVLDSVKRLSDNGEKVMLEVNGPFTILNCIIDPVKIYRSLLKNDRVLLEVFEKIRRNLREYIYLALLSGAAVISYADSAAGIKILGPSLSKKATEIFTIPFLKDIENLIPKNTVFHLCPKTSQLLLALDKAEFRDFEVSPNMNYEESIEFYRMSDYSSPFLGQMCLNRKKQIMRTGKIKGVIIL